MLFPSRKRLPKALKFNYQPRYYDPQKEERAKKRKKIQGDKENGLHQSKTRISDGFKRKKPVRTAMHGQMVRRNLILIAAVIILSFLSYIFLQNYLPALVNTFLK